MNSINVNSTTDAEVSSAVESVAEDTVRENLPVLRKEDLPADWQGDNPVLCVAGRNLIDEAAATMLGQLTTAHGLRARVEGPEALSTANVFRLETTGVMIVCSTFATQIAQGDNYPGMLAEGHRRRHLGGVARRCKG